MEKDTIQPSIEKNLEFILEKLDSRVWTIQELFKVLKGKGYPFLIILLSLPFCQPIQIPGFSTPFGIILIFMGLRMIFGRHIWWPQWVLKKEISTKILKAVVKSSLRFFQFLRPLLQVRWSWLCDHRFYLLHGGFVVLMGIYLALPLPIPLSNILVAWALFMFGLGMIEEDGLFVCLGYVLGGAAVFLLLFLIIWLHTWAMS